MEIRGLGGREFERAAELFRAGEPVTYRGMTLLLRRAELECRVPTNERGVLEPGRALSALAEARFRLGALLASAHPLEAAVGNRASRLVLVRGDALTGEELFELRGDHLRRLGAPPGLGG